MVFYSISQLTSHMKNEHRGRKPYQCKMLNYSRGVGIVDCQSTFANPKYLHMHVHRDFHTLANLGVDSKSKKAV